MNTAFEYPDIAHLAQTPAGARQIFIDAGMTKIEALFLGGGGETLGRMKIPVTGSFENAFRERGLLDLDADAGIYVTGKLRGAVSRLLKGCRRIHQVLPPAALWAAARKLAGGPDGGAPLAVVEISASGYLLVGVDGDGRLHNDQLTVNPRCGAGSGVNLDRVLQKLGLKREDVDGLLAGYTGEAGADRRKRVNVRADRCGVFSASATISDKNQGIPLPFALAVTIKSEVLKACRRLPSAN